MGSGRSGPANQLVGIKRILRFLVIRSEGETPYSAAYFPFRLFLSASIRLMTLPSLGGGAAGFLAFRPFFLAAMISLSLSSTGSLISLGDQSRLRALISLSIRALASGS